MTAVTYPHSRDTGYKSCSNNRRNIHTRRPAILPPHSNRSAPRPSLALHPPKIAAVPIAASWEVCPDRKDQDYPFR